jgi:predicted nucleic acid-binding protein
MEGVREIAQKIHTNEINLITSVLSRAEILRSTLSEEAKEKLAAMMKRRNVVEESTDGKIWDLAHDLRDFYHKIKDGLPTLTLPDAVHLATAIHFRSNVFYTFDEKDIKDRRRALIPLNGNVAGHPLVIKKPLSGNLALEFKKGDQNPIAGSVSV